MLGACITAILGRARLLLLDSSSWLNNWQRVNNDAGRAALSFVSYARCPDEALAGSKSFVLLLAGVLCGGVAAASFPIRVNTECPHEYPASSSTPLARCDGGCGAKCRARPLILAARLLVGSPPLARVAGGCIPICVYIYICIYVCLTGPLFAPRAIVQRVAHKMRWVLHPSPALLAATSCYMIPVSALGAARAPLKVICLGRLTAGRFTRTTS